jgi:hypothetical protein
MPHPKRALCPSVLVLLIAVSSAAPALAAPPKPVWRHLSSARGELPVPGEATHQTAAVVADLDGDGIDDIVIGCRQAPALVWIRRSGDGWTRSVIDPEVLMVEAGGAAWDIDGDGDLDLVFGQDARGSELWWWENPSPDFRPNTPWKRRIIKKGGATQHHDQIFGDFKGTGRAQLVFWNQKAKSLFLADIPADPKKTEPWPFVPIFSGEAGEGADKDAAAYAEGVSVADVDGDGRVDLLAGKFWFKHVKDNEFRAVAVGPTGGRIAGGRFKPGKNAQIVIAPGDGSGPLSFYECAGDPTNAGCWKRRILIPHLVHGHTLDVGDIDGDGKLDIFTGEMARWGAQGEGTHPKAKGYILYGNGRGGFRTTVLVTGHGWHEGKLGNFDGDGGLDIVNKPYIWQTPRLDLWLNGGAGGRRSKLPPGQSRGQGGSQKPERAVPAGGAIPSAK